VIVSVIELRGRAVIRIQREPHTPRGDRW